MVLNETTEAGTSAARAAPAIEHPALPGHPVAHATGRPRDDGREQAILDAALELVAEVGYDCFSMDSLAARAHASKATIYRRWSGKAEVVVEAVRRRSCLDIPTAPDSGSFRDDLLALLMTMTALAEQEDVALLAGITRAMRLDPELADLMRVQVFERKHEELAKIVARAISRGQLPKSADADLLHEVVGALVLNRLLLTCDPIDVDFLVHIVDDIAMPMLRS